MLKPSSWKNFNVLGDASLHAPPPRPMLTRNGVTDRIRAAAFAEVQAHAAFLWAAEQLIDAPLALQKAWRALAEQEEKHAGWLLQRLKELGEDPADRPVSDLIWTTLIQMKTAREFSRSMALAEERGRKAGERFYRDLKTFDPVTSEIFRKIAEEEKSHIALAYHFFPELNPLSPIPKQDKRHDREPRCQTEPESVDPVA